MSEVRIIGVLPWLSLRYVDELVLLDLMCRSLPILKNARIRHKAVATPIPVRVLAVGDVDRKLLMAETLMN